MDGRSRFLLLVAIVACVLGIYVYPLALGTPLMDPDEGIHASIAQEMVEYNDYVIPRYLEKPFRDKPALYFAAQAASLRMFGMNEAAVRLPGLLFALFGCATTALLGWRMFGAEALWYVGLASLTVVLPLILAQSPGHDIALVPFINLFVLAFWEQQAATTARSRWMWLGLMAAATALAILTKGLIGLAVVAPGILAYLVLTHSWSVKLVARCALAMLVGALVASPWFIAMERASPGYLYYYFIQRHLLGFVTEGQEHGEALWYYYLGPVLGGAMPWIVFALVGFLQYWRDDRRLRNPATLLMACWFIGGFAFLCAAGSKLLTYSLPLFPPIAVLGGVGFQRLFHNEFVPALRWMFVNTFRLVSVFGVLSPPVTLLFLQFALDAPSPPAVYAIGILASIAMAVGLVLIERGQGREGLAVGMLWFPLAFITVMTGAVQDLAAEHAQKEHAAMIDAQGDRAPHNLMMVGQRVGSVVFDLSPERRAALRAGHMGEDDTFKLEGLLPPPPGTYVAIRDEEMRRYKKTEEMAAYHPIAVGPFHVLVPPADIPRIAWRPEKVNQ